MNEAIPQFVTVLIDNSDTSMDGDFYPTRLKAQISTTILYSQYLFSQNPNSQIAIGTMSNFELGIRVSFTNSQQKIKDTLNNIASSGMINFSKGIKCAVLALHHCKSTELLNKRILAFVGSENEIRETNVKEISSLLSKEPIGLDLVTIGNNVSNKSLFREIVSSISKNLHSNYLNVSHSNTMLSDDVLASPIGPGAKSKVLLSEYTKNNPDFLAAVELSKSPILNQSPTISMMLQDNSHIVQPLRVKVAVTKKIAKPKIKREVAKIKNAR